MFQYNIDKGLNFLGKFYRDTPFYFDIMRRLHVEGPLLDSGHFFVA